MSTTIGFVVLERNQAGGPLEIPDYSEIARTREEAEETKAANAAYSRSIGRKDNYVIATLEVAEDDRD